MLNYKIKLTKDLEEELAKPTAKLRCETYIKQIDALGKDLETILPRFLKFVRDKCKENEVKYLGQKINPKGITEQIIDDKLFVCVKNKLRKLSFLSRLTRIKIFKVYMISKINHSLPIITLNGLLSLGWKCIRRKILEIY